LVGVLETDSNIYE